MIGHSVRERALILTRDIFSDLDFQTSHPANVYRFVEMFEWFYQFIAIPIKRDCAEINCLSMESLCIDCRNRYSKLALKLQSKKFRDNLVQVREFLFAFIIAVLSVAWVALRKGLTGEKPLAIFSLDSPSFRRHDFRFSKLFHEIEHKNKLCLFVVNPKASVSRDFLLKMRPTIYINALCCWPIFKQKNQSTVHPDSDIQKLLSVYPNGHGKSWISRLIKLSGTRRAFVHNLSRRTALGFGYLKSADCKIIGSQHAASMPVHSPTEFMYLDLLDKFGINSFGLDVMSTWGDYWAGKFSVLSPKLYNKVVVGGCIREIGDFASWRDIKGRSTKTILLLDEQHATTTETLDYLQNLDVAEITLKIRPGGQEFLLKKLKELDKCEVSITSCPIEELNNLWDVVVCTYTSAGIQLAARGFNVAYLYTSEWGDVYEIDSMRHKPPNLNLVRRTEELQNLINFPQKVDLTKKEFEFRNRYFSHEDGAKEIAKMLDFKSL